MTSWLTRAGYAVLVPVGVAIRLVRDPLRIRREPERSNWMPAPALPSTLEGARRDG